MITKKAPYLRKSYTLNVTEKGVSEATPSDLYDTNLAGFKIVKHDCISVLKEFLGDYTAQERNHVYNILAHSLNRLELSQAVKRLSDTNLTFSQLINPILFNLNYEEADSYLFDFLRDLIEENRAKTVKEYKRKGGKLVLDTHHYLYFAFKEYPGDDIL